MNRLWLFLKFFALVTAVNAKPFKDSFSSGDKLSKLRALFSSPKVVALTGGQPLAAYLLPSTDAHQSEYLSDYDFRVRFLSGFTGSNAEVVVTENEALLWTDARYFIQAKHELESNWTMMKERVPGAISPVNWLAETLPPNSTVGFDPQLFSYRKGKDLINKLKAKDLVPVSLVGNLVDEFWTDRPALTQKPLVVMPKNEHGRSVVEKMADLRSKIKEAKCQAIILGALDEIMWQLNIRGGYGLYNPVSYGYLLVSEKEIILFINPESLTAEAAQHFFDLNVKMYDYEDVNDSLTKWWIKHKNSFNKVFITDSTNYMLGSIFGNKAYSAISPVSLMKQVKNPVELNGMRNSHIRDSVALVEGFSWLDRTVKEGIFPTEREIANKMESLRATKDKYRGLSFATISAVGEHAASPHYKIDEDGGSQVTENVPFMLDSGAHYWDGTTDVTRTVWINRDPSKIPQEFKDHNTLVLKGHINVAASKFPNATLAAKLDVLARQAMWQKGLDYGHGTGHGVGHFLNVHELPNGYGYQKGHAIVPGMTITIEPGYYEENKWGIRIENCYEVVKNEGKFVKFESLTLVPIQTSIINLSLLTETEVNWLNAYHARVLSVIGKILVAERKFETYHWLKRQCQHVVMN